MPQVTVWRPLGELDLGGRQRAEGFGSHEKCERSRPCCSAVHLASSLTLVSGVTDFSSFLIADSLVPFPITSSRALLSGFTGFSSFLVVGVDTVVSFPFSRTIILVILLCPVVESMTYE